MLRLAEEALFGPDVLMRFTVKGSRGKLALPVDELILAQAYYLRKMAHV